MKFCALSKKEVESLSLILEREEISYEVSVDKEILEANDESMKFNLRHLNTPSISTSVLVLEVDDHFWDRLSEQGLKEFSELGFSQVEVDETHEVEVHDQEAHNPSTRPLRSVLNQGSKKLVGFHFLIYFIVIGAISLFIRYFIAD